MSTFVELGNDAGPLIGVTLNDCAPEILTEFTRQCFFTGEFPSRGNTPYQWLLDCRAGLGDGEMLQAIARALLAIASERQQRQFVGTGFGAYLLVGAMLGLDVSAQGGLVRSQRKSHGRQQLVEGQIDRQRPVCVIDDVINSGESASQLVEALRNEGFQPDCCLSIFHFEWGGGVERLSRLGVDCDGLARVTRQTLPAETPAFRWWNFRNLMPWRSN